MCGIHQRLQQLSGTHEGHTHILRRERTATSPPINTPHPYVQQCGQAKAGGSTPTHTHPKRHPMTTHQHGRPGTYNAGCRCTTCTTAWRRYQKRWELDRTRGHQRLTPTQPIRDHVTWLRTHGMSERDIATAAGWKWPNSLRAALTHNTIRISTAQKILSVHPTMQHDISKEFPGWMIARRLQALTALGWTTRHLATTTGLNEETIRALRRGKNTVYRNHATTIIDLYTTHAGIPYDGPGSHAARRLAQRRHWFPPAAWDNIDNPNEKPSRRIINVA